MTDSMPSRIAVSSEVLSRDLDQETVLLNLETEQYYVLDEVGMRTWQMLAEHGDVERAVSDLLTEYEVDEATLRQDMSDLIAELVEAKLITVESA